MTEINMQKRHVQFNLIAERCKGCGFCVELCPRHILHKSTEINSKGYHLINMKNSNECTKCGICEMICPDFAIIITDATE